MFRILCTADIHLGRAPTKLHPELDAKSYGAREALKRTVGLAKELAVDAFVLTGDIADESNAFIEAYAVLRPCLEELLHAGISVFAVAGNHDFAVLRRLSEELPGFKLLGKDGEWEEVLVEREGKGVLRIQGRSFHKRYSEDNPLESYQKPHDDILTIALLHCDVDILTSKYGPVSLSELMANAPTAWVLGHIHKPTVFQEEPLIFYPGSLQGMDPGEPGMHGPWLLEAGKGDGVKAEHYALSALRYERISVSLENVSDKEEIESLALRALKSWYEEHRESLGETSAIACRIEFIGKTSAHQHVYPVAETLVAMSPIEFEGVRMYVEKVEDSSQPEVVLEEIAQHNDPAGLLAKKLVIIRDTEPRESFEAIIGRAKDEMDKRRSDTAFLSLEDRRELTDEVVREKLLSSGTLILDQLLSQKQQ